MRSAVIAYWRQSQAAVELVQRHSARLWLVPTALLIVSYPIIQLVLKNYVSADLRHLVVQPLIWMFIGLISYMLIRIGKGVEWRPSGEIIILATILGVFQVAAWLLAGFAFGFGRSPHGTELPVMLGNLLFVCSVLVGTELARASIIRSLGEHKPAFSLLTTAVLLTVIAIPVGRYGLLTDVPSVLRFSGKVLLPNLSQNILASIMALVAGPLPALIYRGLIEAFEWFFPLHPDLQMIVSAFVGTMPAALGLLAVEKYLDSSAEEEVETEEAEPEDPISLSWLIAGAVSVTILFFNIGAFGYRPTLVVGPSMEPTFGTGDLVVTRPVAAESLAAGDVVRFRTRSGRPVIHRIQEVRRVEGELWYITKGDNNNLEDAPVYPEQIEGKLVLLVPELGWPAMFFRELVNWLRHGLV